MEPSASTLNNLTVLYLLKKSALPLTGGQIEQAVLQSTDMNFFDLQEAISQLVEIKYIEAFQEDTSKDKRYSITDEGSDSLSYFANFLTSDIRNSISEYIFENSAGIRQDYDTAATYFNSLNSNDITVKCSLYEENTMLMELSLTVATSSQAKLICDNWKNNVTKMYGAVLNTLISGDK